MTDQITQGKFGGFVLGGHPATYWEKTWTKVQQDFNVKTLLDIGCGDGTSTMFWQNALQCSVLGIDGFQTTTPRSFPFLLNNYNETSALKDEEFDLCICSEFAEHIFAENQYLFLKDFEHAKYILFNAATPGQTAEDTANGFQTHNHVNEQSLTYWIKHVERHGFTYDHDYSMDLRKVAYQDALVRPHDPFNHFIHKGLFFKRNNVKN